ncbi:MAG: flavodoxin domain-containing protein [Akkermansiaceae bacterium]|nr:flavodoxin domain-containing protein [Akkermansiaceae bacterium]
MLPEHAPFSPDQRLALDALVTSLDDVQRAWLSGYLATGGTPSAAASTVPTAAAGAKLTVLYGTESGNSETLADRSVKEARKRGFQASMVNMADLDPARLATLGNLLVIVSTWGDGEPPETAATFYHELMGSELDLSKLSYSVCALGDTSYEKFCETGRSIDAKLAALGANRVTERQDCDVDYEEAYGGWLKSSLDAIGPAGGTATTAMAVSAPASAGFGKSNPFPAEINDKVLLSGTGSAKENLHIEFSLAGSGMDYEPGDTLAVLAVNAPDVVESVLKAAKLTGTEEIDTKISGRKPLADALRDDFDITALSRNVLKKLAAITTSGDLEALLADDAKEKLHAYLVGREIVDAIEDFAPGGLSADALACIFRKLPPRLYSIASSPLAHPGEVHLTVAAVRYETWGRKRKGVCSTYLADLVKAGDKVRVFTQPNKNFRLPANPDTPVIMIGPGTGVAPFRAFVEHRAATGAKGRNWLIMGDQHYLFDFSYQLEWQEHLKNGVLTRLDVAFSRDQPEKIYVQQRMLQHGAEIWKWLEDGAHFYVCGDASRMAHDVHEALLSIVQSAGKTHSQAEAYLEDLKKSKRYQRDVY